MSTHEILEDFGVSNDVDQLSLSAGAVIAVFRRKYPVTYSRKKKGSISSHTDFAIKLRDRVTIVDDIATVAVTSNKASHVTSMVAELKPGANYISELLPGDFIFVWLVQSKEAVREILRKLNEGEACNEWQDGLKFFGRINSCRKKMITDGGTGLRRTSFMVNAAGFTELDANIYYEPYMALPAQGIVTSNLQYFGVAISDFISNQTGGVVTNKVVPAMYNVLYGTGIPKDANVTLGSSEVRLTEGLDNPNAFLIPTEVAKVFGVSRGTKAGGLVGWNDLMEFVHGIQTFTNAPTPSFRSRAVGGLELNIESEVQRGSTISPSIISAETARQRGAAMNPIFAEEKGRIRFTGKEQMGTFVPQTAAFTGQKNAWTILKQFVNPAVNEMYTSMRVNNEGRIFPTLTLRQLPFTSGIISSTFIPEDPLTPKQREKANQWRKQLEDAGGENSKRGQAVIANYRKTKEYRENQWGLVAKEPIELMSAVTRFSELPRWRVAPILVKSFDVGRSDSLRMNYVHIYGEAGVPAGVNQSRQFVVNKPIRDDVDIARSGLRPYMMTVPCSPKDIVNGGAGAWMNLMADIVMNQELTLTGLINMYGVVAPIVPGDNVEYDGVVAHIEAVNHNFLTGPSGVCTFTTNIEFTNGVSAEQLSNADDQSRYVGLKSADISTFDPTVLTSGSDPSVGTGEDAADLARDSAELDTPGTNEGT